MTRAFLSALLMVAASAQQLTAQAHSLTPFLPRSPIEGGAGVFVMPHVQTMFGRFLAGGEAELGWGDPAPQQVGAFAGLALLANVYISAGWKGASIRSPELNGSDRAFAISIAGPRAGIAAARRYADTHGEPFASELRGTELRAWARPGNRLELGVSLRTADVAERTQGVDQRRYLVAGYEFLSTARFDYVHVARHRDVELDVTTALAGFSLTGVAGRGFADSFASQRTWAYLRVQRPLPRGLDLLIEAGRNDGGRAAVPVQRGFVRLGFRVDLTRRVEPLTAEPLLPVQAAAAAIDASGSSSRLLVTAPHAQSVEVRGDFTRWETRPMTRQHDGTWAIPVHAGVLRFNIRLDGEAWTVPAGLPVVADEFSGAPVAVVVVRRQ